MFVTFEVQMKFGTWKKIKTVFRDMLIWGIVSVAKGYFIYIYDFLRVQSFTNELNIHSVTFRFLVFVHLRRFQSKCGNIQVVSN